MILRRLVLDIETALDRPALDQTGRSATNGFDRSWLHRIVSVSTLSFTFSPAEAWFEGFELNTVVARDVDDEPRLLARVEDTLATLDDGLLITFNGASHDLPVLLQRRWRHWQFSPTRLTELMQVGNPRHQDVMRVLGHAGVCRWPALGDVCAGLGIPFDATARRKGVPPPLAQLAKGQTDVAATFVLHCWIGAAAAGSAALLANGWTAFANHVLDSAPTHPHLTQFAASPLALIARRRSGACDGDEIG